MVHREEDSCLITGGVQAAAEGTLLRNSRAGIPVLVILVQIRFYILLLILPGFWRHNFFFCLSLCIV